MNQRVPIPMQDGRYSFAWGGDGRHGGSSLEWVIFALLLLLIVLVVALLVLSVLRRSRFAGPHFRGLHGPPGGGPRGGPDPLSIARMRYAGGEIGRDEFVQIVQDLGGEPPPQAAP